MDESPVPTPPIRRRAVILSKWERISSSLVGLGACVTGGAAVFLTDNQAGSTAFLILGGFGLLLGITGRVPNRIGKDGVNYDPVDPATKAVENVLSNEDVPLDTKETIAAAVRQEIDKRGSEQPDQKTPHAASNERLSAQANLILFEASVRDAIRKALPAETRFVTEVRRGGRAFDGIIEIPNSGEGRITKVAFEITGGTNVNRRFREILPRVAGLNADAFLCVVKGIRSGGIEDNLRKLFQLYASRADVKNAHLVFVNDLDDQSLHELSGATQVVIKAAMALHDPL